MKGDKCQFCDKESVADIMIYLHEKSISSLKTETGKQIEDDVITMERPICEYHEAKISNLLEARYTDLLYEGKEWK